MYKRSTKIADLNLLLTVFIVLLHSLYNPLRLSSESGMYTWIYVFLKTLFDVAVPTFFFISSFLFFRYLDFERIKSKIKSRFKSLIVPYVIFSVVFAIFFMTIDYFNGSGVLNIKSLPADIYKATYDPTIWYLRTLFYYFLMSPIVLSLIKRFCVLEYLFICILCIIINVFITISYDNVFFWLPILMVGSYVGYNYPDCFDNLVLSSKILFFLVLLNITLIFIVSYFPEKSIPYYLYRMISPFLFIPISVNILKLNKIRIHEYTFFVFMIHYVVIRIVSYIFPHEITIFLPFLRPCIILFICFIIAWCLKFVLNNKLWKLLNGSR